MVHQKSFFLSLVCIVLTVLTPRVHGQDTTTVQAFNLKDGQGKTFDLQAHKDKAAIVVFFTSSNCAFATRYLDRINQLHLDFKEKNISFVAINSNDASLSQRDEESLMRQYVPFAFPYLKDESQAVAKGFGAVRNPEAFVLQPINGTFKKVYQGAIDDNPFEKSVNVSYVREVLTSILKKETPKHSKVAGKGCDIRWK
ncbi:MAG: redoxin domain-containing protein [Bacteroidota bacterium]